MHNVLAEITALDRSKINTIRVGCTPAGNRPDTGADTTVVGGTVTDYLAHIPQTTLPTATPANTWMAGRLANPFNFELSLWNGLEPRGRVVPGAGALAIDDPADDLAAWRHYVWRGARVQLWPCEVRSGKTADPDDRLADLAVDGIEVGRKGKTLRLRTLDYIFNAPLLTERYGGTGGEDGDPELAGVLKPLLIGYAFNLQPLLIAKTPRIYQVSQIVPGTSVGNLNAVDAARDGGSPLTLVGDYPDYAALAAATLSVNQLATCLDRGLVRTGGSVQRALTLDVRASFDNGISTLVSVLVNNFAAKGRLTESVVSGVAGDAGLYIREQVSIGQALDRVMASTPEVLYVDLGREIRNWKIAAPSASASRTYYWGRDIVGEPQIVDVPPRRGTNVFYQQNWTPQGPGDLDPTLADDLKRLYGQAAQQAIGLSTGGGAWADSAVVEVPSLLRYAADAQVHMQTWNELFGVARQIVTVTVRWLQPDELNTKANAGPLYDLTTTIALDGLDLYGIAASKRWRVISVAGNWRSRTLTLKLWG